MKPVVKSLQKLMENSDKNVREEVGFLNNIVLTLLYCRGHQTTAHRPDPACNGILSGPLMVPDARLLIVHFMAT